MYNVNFGSTFLQVPINYENPDKDVNECLYDIKNTSQERVVQWITQGSDYNLYTNFIVDDKFDEYIESFLKINNIRYKKLTNEELFDEKNIKSRFRVDPDFANRLSLVELNTKKITDLLKKDKDFYVGDFPNINGMERYDGFKEYIKTGKPVNASMLYLRETDEGLFAGFQDGRHRYAVLRDMGFEKIPFAIDNESYEVAKKYNLL